MATIARGQNFKPEVLNIVGSSSFGRYPKISVESTFNMFESDNFMVPYAGYKIAINYKQFETPTGAIPKKGRACFNSIKFDKIVLVLDTYVYLVIIDFDQTLQKPVYTSIQYIGSILNATNVVYIAENNAPQIMISDGEQLYYYSAANPTLQVVSGINFVPGYLTSHENHFLCSTTSWDSSDGLVSNSIQVSSLNSVSFPQTQPYAILISTKPDVAKAVVRFPSKGNMIFAMGTTVTESWFLTGSQLAIYQRNNQFNIDYGCLSPATVAYSDEFVVWLAASENSGPVIMFSDGGMPQKITTDGIEYLLSNFQAPQDSEAFIYRQDGHLFYHINFYTDNYSLFYDFNTRKFYNACDQNYNYFIAGSLCYYRNQYYFTSPNTANLYAFDTIFYNYQDTLPNGVVVNEEIPRMRTCRNIRLPSQEYFIINDVGFTIESGETNDVQQPTGEQILITQSGNQLITQSGALLITQQPGYLLTTPAVDLSISTDGGASFGNEWRYNLPAIGQRKNRLMWWQIGMANDFVAKFRFWGLNARFVATDGIANIRQ